ncbi:MAG TPA: thymidylate kinase [Candidatus Dormibacteraeota bacterium]|nr:thymidylate kinase [Candidatus Dormibacteraeota bacterium]
MTQRGKLIVIEGIDGSGKRTQLELLSKALAGRGLSYVSCSFPCYESSFGRLVARFLNGQFGPLDSVDPHFSALLYAGDRFEYKPELEAALAAGKTILSDRYIGSNLAHQTARMPAEKRPEFLAWLQRLEYGLYALPAEDLVIYLRLPAARAHQLVGRKATRKYTALRRDLLEADVLHLEQAAAIYDQLALQPNWVTIECVDTVGAMRLPQEIAPVIWAAAQPLLVQGAAASRAAKLSGSPRVS